MGVSSRLIILLSTGLFWERRAEGQELIKIVNMVQLKKLDGRRVNARDKMC